MHDQFLTRKVDLLICELEGFSGVGCKMVTWKFGGRVWIILALGRAYMVFALRRMELYNSWRKEKRTNHGINQI